MDSSCAGRVLVVSDITVESLPIGAHVPDHDSSIMLPASKK